jgi:hypothetical protein
LLSAIEGILRRDREIARQRVDRVELVVLVQHQGALDRAGEAVLALVQFDVAPRDRQPMLADVDRPVGA